ncbi:MAG: hypothetical protein V3T22_00505, partial [Planctomycetota bacterium]
VLLGGWLWLWLDGQRAARDAQVAEQVDAALDEADRAGRRGDWTEALAAVERARGLATSGLADAVEAEAGPIENAAWEAAETANLAERRAALRSKLRRIASLIGSSSADQGPAYASAFEIAGIEFGTLTDDEVVARLRETGLEIELCLSLDDWARELRRIAGGNTEESKRLLRIAIRTDGDETRREIRAAENKGDIGPLKPLAEAGLGSDAPVATVRALAGALAGGGQREAALDLLRRTAEDTLDDHDLHVDLARTLLAEQHPLAEMQASLANEALEYLTAALAMRPSNPVTLRLAGRAHALAGEPSEATWRFGAALKSDTTLEPELTANGDALDQMLLASALSAGGRMGPAREALVRGRAKIEDEGTTGVLRAVLETVSGELEQSPGAGND